MTPNAIADHFNMTRQAISKHMKILTECELVKPDHKGREIYYQLEIDKIKEVDKWVEQYRKIWETRLDQLDNLLATIKKTEIWSVPFLQWNTRNKMEHTDYQAFYFVPIF